MTTQLPDISPFEAMALSREWALDNPTIWNTLRCCDESDEPLYPSPFSIVQVPVPDANVVWNKTMRPLCVPFHPRKNTQQPSYRSLKLAPPGVRTSLSNHSRIYSTSHHSRNSRPGSRNWATLDRSRHVSRQHSLIKQTMTTTQNRGSNDGYYANGAGIPSSSQNRRRGSELVEDMSCESVLSIWSSQEGVSVYLHQRQMDYKQRSISHSQHGYTQDSRYRSTGRSYSGYSETSSISESEMLPPGSQRSRRSFYQDHSETSDISESELFDMQPSLASVREWTRKTDVGSQRSYTQTHQGSVDTTHVSESGAMLEIQPGVSLPLRGAKETIRALQTGHVISTQCMACGTTLACVHDAEYVICPCRVVSPIFTDHPMSNSTPMRGGVGLGLILQ